MTSTKVEEIRAWSTPEKVVNVQGFMGFANFYHRFIKGVSKIAKQLTDLTKKGIKWTWTSSYQQACDKLKEMFTTGPILTHFDDSRPTKLETDASDFALGAVLSQVCEDEKWHPVAFHSRKFSPAEINYDVHDVTGASYRQVNSQVATAPKLKVKDKDKVNNSRRIKTVKLNIVKLKASLNKFSRGKVGYRSRMPNA